MGDEFNLQIGLGLAVIRVLSRHYMVHNSSKESPIIENKNSCAALLEDLLSGDRPEDSTNGTTTSGKLQGDSRVPEQ